jgi:diacylglycerol kinase family enzyme
MQATLVYNPGAGSGRLSAEQILELMAEAGFSPSFVSAKDKELQQRLAGISGIVIAAGGDGTIARVITQLEDRDIPIAILPLGTANNIARAFGIFGTIEEIIAGLPTGNERKLDVGVASGPFEERRFVESVGVGALADVTTKKNKGEGSIASQIERGREAFRKVLKKAKPIKAAITVDDKTIEEEMLLAEIMNIGFVGPNLRLAPQAETGDGRFDVVILPAASREEMLEWLHDPERDAPPVIFESGRCITLNKNGAVLRIGDKPMTDVKNGEVRVEIESAQVKILVPSPPVKTVKTVKSEAEQS